MHLPEGDGAISCESVGSATLPTRTQILHHLHHFHLLLDRRSIRLLDPPFPPFQISLRLQQFKKFVVARTQRPRFSLSLVLMQVSS